MDDFDFQSLLTRSSQPSLPKQAAVDSVTYPATVQLEHHEWVILLHSTLLATRCGTFSKRPAMVWFIIEAKHDKAESDR